MESVSDVVDWLLDGREGHGAQACASQPSKWLSTGRRWNLKIMIFLCASRCLGCRCVSDVGATRFKSAQKSEKDYVAEVLDEECGPAKIFRI